LNLVREGAADDRRGANSLGYALMLADQPGAARMELAPICGLGNRAMEAGGGLAGTLNRHCGA
jgi:Flp pilus assembly pilin Flp